ncbi:Valine--tRNA ligase [Rhizoctonia solani]|uniref:Valine--tRNA ligase n=1 Tax=Rhizoctonia solani TaxID=456999 RepID=A0A0K6FZQ8_9AGAM|nr:Valine--tRNA ligase [Rhizoctonia solani]
MANRVSKRLTKLSDGIYLYCTVCTDALGNPTKFDKKNRLRHIRSTKHQWRKALREKQRRQATKVASPRLDGVIEKPNPFTTPFSVFEPDLPYSAYHRSVSTESDSEYDSGAELANRLGSGGSRHFDDLFTAASERQQPPAAASRDGFSEDTETDSTSHSDIENGDAYSLRFDQYNPASGHCDWYPWGSKSIFLADQLMNSLRTKFGRRQMRAALAYARETGGRDIPSYKTLRKAQARMRNILGNPTVRKVSYAGNVYYMNRVTSGLAQDLANPLLRKHMSFYPHYDDNRMSQIWHGGKLLKDVPDHVLTPMIQHNNQIYYVGELVQRTHGWFLPLRWMLKGEQRKMYAIGHIVEETQTGLQVRSDRRISVPVASFICSFPELLRRDSVPVFDDDSQTFRTNMPHPLRAIAGLRPVYSIPIILFMDDVSGNRTNLWNKHISAYISNAAITREVLNMEYSVRFVLTSKHATPSELMEGIRDDLKESFQEPIVAYDCENEEEVLIRGYPALSAADNPMQSEQCSCQLQNANYFCRTCGAGGTLEFKQSESGYVTLFKPGEMRLPAQTRERVNTLLEMSIQPGQRTRIKEQARDWGVKDSHGQLIIDKMLDMGQKMRERNGRYYKGEPEIIASLQSELDSARQQGCINAFLDMEELGFNVHKDTPTEILHTVLLGVVKYFWGQTVFVLSRAHRMSTLETRLGSLNISGLNIDSISEKYMCQYTGSLVGKHFKTLAQLMPFACYDLVEPDLLEVWLLLGRLTVLLWFTEIENIDLYIAEMQVIIDDFLLAAARCSPSIIVLKPKFHFLVHLPMYIQRFGPPILFATERFESFHGVFRAGSIHSNRQAPSCDIADYFVGLNRLKHICSGGYWKEGDSWVRASSCVREFVAGHKEFYTLLGLPIQSQPVAGSITLMPRHHLSIHKPSDWSEFTRGSHSFASCSPGPAFSHFFRILSALSQACDSIKTGSNILFQATKFGQVEALFGCALPSGTTKYYASVKMYSSLCQSKISYALQTFSMIALLKGSAPREPLLNAKSGRTQVELDLWYSTQIANGTY